MHLVVTYHLTFHIFPRQPFPRRRCYWLSGSSTNGALYSYVFKPNTDYVLRFYDGYAGSISPLITRTINNIAYWVLGEHQYDLAQFTCT